MGIATWNHDYLKKRMTSALNNPINADTPLNQPTNQPLF